MDCDYQQLFYLCDPAIHMLYVDSDFTQRSGGSSQKSRLIKLADVWRRRCPLRHENDMADCIYCRKPLTGTEPPEHVIPQSFGTFPSKP